MNEKPLLLLGALVLILFVSGCIGDTPTDTPPDNTGQIVCNAPKKVIGDVCCNDQNNNNICDMDEAGCPSSCDDSNSCTNDTCSGSTNFDCEHITLYPCCGNGVCDNTESVKNECPADCDILSMTDFQYEGTPDFIEDDTFVFIHTSAIEAQYRVLFLNLTGGTGGMENIRYTFRCNSSQHGLVDSIASEPENVTDNDDYDSGRYNVFDNSYYLIYSFFFLNAAPAYRLDIESLGEGSQAAFHFKVKKKDPQSRDDLECLFKFYFMKPRKVVHKVLELSYI
jgi:hypothetical protein